MPALAHALVNVTLCPAMARLPATAQIPLRVRLAYHRNGYEVDKTYDVERGTGAAVPVEFDAVAGTYRLELDSAKYRCGTSAFVAFLAGRPRVLAETLVESPGTTQPVVLLSGTAPLSFGYVRPTFVVLPGTAVCAKPVPDPIVSHVSVENEQNAYYVTLPFDPALSPPPGGAPPAGASANPAEQPAKPANAPSPDPGAARSLADSLKPVPGGDVVAMRLRSATGLYHYLRVPFAYPPPWGGWPDAITFNIEGDTLADMATEEPGVLLCPKLFVTTVTT